MTTEEWKARMCSAQLSTFKRWQDGTSLKAPRGFWQNSLLDYSLSSTVLEHASPRVLMNWFCNDFFKSCLSWKNKSFMRLRCLLLFFGAVQFLSCVRLLWDPIDCSLPGSSVHWISQARVLEWVVISSSRGSSWLRDQILDSGIGRQILYRWATWEAWSHV